MGKVKEQTVENLLKGNNKFEPPRFMTVSQAAKMLLKLEAEFGGGVCLPDAKAIGLARVGHETQVIRKEKKKSFDSEHFL
jgi:diphthine synthase